MTTEPVRRKWPARSLRLQDRGSASVAEAVRLDLAAWFCRIRDKMGAPQRHASCVLGAGLMALAITSPVSVIAADARPQRIVSLNLCTDELLLRLADPSQIVSVSWLARDPLLSNVPQDARRYPANRGLAEEVLGLEPDLVLAGRYTTPQTVALLRRLGLKVVEFDFPTSVDQSVDLVRRFGAVIGQEQRAAELSERMAKELAAFRAKETSASPPTALIYQPNGYTAGAGSLMDSLLATAGLANMATSARHNGYGPLSLEAVARHAPDIVIIDQDSTAPSLARQILEHPVLAALPNPPLTIAIPSRLWICAGPAMVEAVRLLRKARDEISSSRGMP